MDVGIQYIEVYFPKTYVEQKELEQHDKISEGKYQIGLGQQGMSFVYNYEDVNSMALTSVRNLLRKYNIDPKQIGRLEIGTETLTDKSKSTKTVLMRLFEQSDIEGVTTINACYGGTQALFNSIAWMQSEAWDGRLAIVVCVDVAVYAKGPARPTGGAGAVAMLISPNATFVLEKNRSTHIADMYDFYKPIMSSEYPTVDGQLSITSYLDSIDKCYEGLNKKEQFNTQKIDYMCFHSPFHKMVQKSFCRFLMHDILNGAQKAPFEVNKQNFNEIQAQLLKQYKQQWESKVLPSCLLSQQLGNIYTGSLYTGLISLIENYKELQGKRIAMFSYGSGSAASLFILRCNRSTLEQFKIQQITQRLSQRSKINCQEYEDHLMEKQLTYNQPNKQFNPDFNRLFNETYYLKSIDDKYRRQYVLYDGKQQINFTSNNISKINRLSQIKNQIEQKDPSLSERGGEIKEPVSTRKLYNKGWIKQKPYRILMWINLKMVVYHLQNANLMIENCIGKLSLPIGLGLNFLINGNFYNVPMAIEEPSVIAAASAAAKVISECGNGFQVVSSRPVMMGQIQLLDITNPDRLQCVLDQNKQLLIDRGNQACQSMVKRGGGVENIQFRYLNQNQGSLDIYINVCDSMGANLVNTVVEHLGPLVEELTQTRVGIKILSNLCSQRQVSAEFELQIEKLAYKGFSGQEVAKMIVESYQFAQLDIYRAVTHNKGILNGIEAVCLATGQDTRAVNASLHAHASLNQYKPLTQYFIKENKLIGQISVPISVGSQGGVIPQNPLYQQCLRILDYPNSQKLAEIMVCVGLASNFAALRALTVEGIQKGHMNLHARNLAIASQIPEFLVEDAVQFMRNRNSFRKETAEEFLGAYSIYQIIPRQQDKRALNTLCTFSGEFYLEGSSDKIELHIVFDCSAQESIHLNFQSQSEISQTIFGSKGLEWLQNLFTILNQVRIDSPHPTKNTTLRIKLLAILINLVSYNMLKRDQSTGYFIKELIANNIDLHFENKDLAFRYGLALLSELIRIFKYNIEQFVGSQDLRQALNNELETILISHIECFQLWEKVKSKQFDNERFWEFRKKRLSCTMMLLCDCINMKIEPNLIDLVKCLGDIYEYEITLARDTSKWNNSAITQEPNTFVYWLLQNDKLMVGNQFVQEFVRIYSEILNEKKKYIDPLLPSEMKHLSTKATRAVQMYYGQKSKL
ncbi:hypothetical protein pb186bvf_000641 [Paramecium bursaria]